MQHRGGPRGFLKVLDDRTLAFADFVGNKQYITTGNLLENDRAFLFLINYADGERIKIWGRAHVVNDDKALFDRLDPLYPWFRSYGNELSQLDEGGLMSRCIASVNDPSLSDLGL